MSAAVETDGRRRRSARTRAAVVEAMAALIEAGDPSPTSKAIAERAGITQRTLFRHFDSMTDVVLALVRRQRSVFAEHVRPVDPGAPLEERVDALVAQRVELYEAIGPLRRAALRARHENPDVADGLVAADRLLRRQLGKVFGHEVETLSGPRRRVILEAIDQATSWETWERLTTTRHLPRGEGAAVMALMLDGVLRAS